MSTASRALESAPGDDAIRRLELLEARIRWLSTWTIHHANHLRPKRDGLKVGGHQASSASSVTLMTALFFSALRPQDRIAVKPHAAPVFHAIQYLFGQESRARLERFRAIDGVQSYPSRTKDRDGVDFSTGSEGMGAAMTIFAALAQDYVRAKRLAPADLPEGRMVALLGDAEFDEGNVFEALLEGWKHDVRNVWWVIDYNRQSLDRVLDDHLHERIEGVFRSLGWEVVVLKYGRRLEAAFARPGGGALREWIDSCPNDVYSALVYAGGSAWRERLRADLGHERGVATLLAEHDDEALARLMTNLGGHDVGLVTEAFAAVADDRPRCFVAYTIKGYGLPLAGHKDNHSGLLTPEQVDALREELGIAEGEEWEPWAGLSAADAAALRRFVERVPFAPGGLREHAAAAIPVPRIDAPRTPKASTQEAFGRILRDLAGGDGELARRIVTSSPDVTVTTNLGGWVNRRGVFGRRARGDAFRELRLASAQRWNVSGEGQHVELGIAENNFFVLLAAFGLSGPLFGARLLPIGAIYDTFLPRGLDALNYACYQDARFVVAGTPSGLTLAPEGGAHQSIGTPLIGAAQPHLTSFEPAYADEVAAILEWSLRHLQEDDGGSVYLRLSTRTLDQPGREIDEELRAAVLAGGYWLVPPGDGAELAIVCSGVTVAEAEAAHGVIRGEVPGAGLAVVTSTDRLHRGWLAARRAARAPSFVERLLAPLDRHARLVTVVDAHPLTLSWLGSVRGHAVEALGVERFGRSGDLPDLYREYGLDVDAIVEAVARACLASAGWRPGAA